MNKLRFAILATVCLAAVISAPALAHAFVTRTDPVDGATLSEAPHQLRLWFSEAVALNLSKFAVLGSDGQPIQIGTVQGDASDPALVIIELPDLAPGAYRVTWDALSTDDLHITSGSIVFGVQTPAGAAVASAESTPPLYQVLARWIDFVAQAMLSGALALLLFARPAAKLNATVAAVTERRLLTLALWAGGAALITSLGGLLGQAIALGADRANWSVIEATGQLLAQTEYGSRWLMREGWTVALVALLIWQYRQVRPNRLILGATVPLLVALAVLQAMNGHATAFTDVSLVRIAADTIHLLGADVWVGGLIALTVVITPLLRRGFDESAVARSILRRFGLLASGSLGALLTTGLYNSGQQVASLDALLFTLYGRALLLKIGLVLIVGFIGLTNSARLHPRVAEGLQRAVRRPIGSPRYLGRTVLLEAIGAIGLLLFAATLGSSQPARGPEFDPPSDDPTTQTASTNVDGLFVTLSIKPNRPGQNFISIGAFNTRRPAPAPIEQVTVRLISPSGEPIDSAAQLTTKDKYQVTGDQITQPGEWQITIEAQRPGLPVARWTVPWTVLPASTLSARPVTVSNLPLAPWLNLAAVISAVLMISAALLLWLRRPRRQSGAQPTREIEHDVHSMSPS